MFCHAGSLPKSRRGFVPEARREKEAQWGYGDDEQRDIGYEDQASSVRYLRDRAPAPAGTQPEPVPWIRRRRAGRGGADPGPDCTSVNPRSRSVGAASTRCRHPMPGPGRDCGPTQTGPVRASGARRLARAIAAPGSNGQAARAASRPARTLPPRARLARLAHRSGGTSRRITSRPSNSCDQSATRGWAAAMARPRRRPSSASRTREA